MSEKIDREINKFCDTRIQVCKCNGIDCFFSVVKTKEEYMSSSKKKNKFKK